MSNAFNPFSNESDRTDGPDEFVPTGPANDPSFEPLVGNSAEPSGGEAYASEPVGQATYSNLTPTAEARKPRRGPGLGIIITLVLLVVLAGGGGFAGWRFLQGGKEKPVVVVPPKDPGTGTDEQPIKPADTFETWMASLKSASSDDLNALNADDANSAFGKVCQHLGTWDCSEADIDNFLSWAEQAKHQNKRLATRIRFLRSMLRNNSAVGSSNASISPVTHFRHSHQFPGANNSVAYITFPASTAPLGEFVLQPQAAPAAGIAPALLLPPPQLIGDESEDWGYSVEIINSAAATGREKSAAAQSLAAVARRKGASEQAGALLDWAIKTIDTGKIPEAFRGKVDQERFRLLQQRIAIVTDANQRLNDSLKVTPAQLRGELAELNIVMRMSDLDPQTLGQVPATVVAPYKTRWDLLSMLPAQLEQQLKDAETGAQPVDASSFRIKLRQLREDLISLSIEHSRLQLSPVLSVVQLVTDRQSLNRQASLISARLNDLTDKKVESTKLDPLKRRLVNLQPELAAVTALSPDQGTRLFTELQSLDADTTTLQLAVPAAPSLVPAAPVTFARSNMSDLLTRLKLDDAALQGLKPKDAKSPSQKLWTDLEADLKAVRQSLQTAEMAKQELTPQEYAEVASKLSGIVYAANRLQAEKELASAGSSSTSNPGRQGLGTGPVTPDPQVAAIAQRVAKLESAKPPVDLSTTVNQNSTSITNLNTSVAQVKTDVETLKGKTVAVTLDPTQLDQIRRKVEESLQNSPAPVAPGLPTDAALAREYAAPGYHYYYDRDWNRALRQFTLATQADPYNPVYRYFLALTMYGQGRFSDAHDQARKGRQLEDRFRAAQISAQLHKVQGTNRAWLEDIRMNTKVPGLGVARNP